MRLEPYQLEALFGRILSPFERFLQRTTAGGLILLGTTIVTLVLANTALGPTFRNFWHTSLRVGIGSAELDLTLHHWVNDGLMTLFFLLVGLELKREILVGELSSLRDASLPVIAALGGMIVPALIYHLLNPTGPAAHGWGIPMATDIAFSIGILVLLAWRIPHGLIVFLAALAIADDLGAVLVIAIFYTRQLNMTALVVSSVILAILILLNRGGIRHPLPYALLGLGLWLAVLKSGVHATIAGVLLALTIPARPMFTVVQFEERLNELRDHLTSGPMRDALCEHPLQCPEMATVAQNLEKAANDVQSPQQRMEHALHPWVTFLVIPVFAFCNAAIDFGALAPLEMLRSPVTLGVILGLVLGKFLGVTSFVWLALKLGLGRLPNGVRWVHVQGMAWIAGIGFTMSIFIGELAFDDPSLVETAKFGILTGSLVAALLGLSWLYLGTKGRKPVRSDLITRGAEGSRARGAGAERSGGAAPGS